MYFSNSTSYDKKLGRWFYIKIMGASGQGDLGTLLVFKAELNIQTTESQQLWNSNNKNLATKFKKESV